MQSNFQKIPELVKAGKLDIKTVDTAVSRVLRAKFEMGLFENPYPAGPKSQWNNLIHSKEAVKLARQLDKESIVLLENHNNTLPLKKKGDIAVIGPMAHGFMNVSATAKLMTCIMLLIMISTGITWSTRASTGVLLPWTASRLRLERKQTSTTPRDASDGATTSPASPRPSRQRRNPTWSLSSLAPGQETRWSCGKGSTQRESLPPPLQ